MPTASARNVVKEVRRWGGRGKTRSKKGRSSYGESDEEEDDNGIEE